VVREGEILDVGVGRGCAVLISEPLRIAAGDLGHLDAGENRSLGRSHVVDQVSEFFSQGLVTAKCARNDFI
jgi:hypothetical protein